MTTEGPRPARRDIFEETGDTRLLALVRLGFGLLLTHEAWFATRHVRSVGFFGAVFHQPLIPEWLVVLQGGYRLVLGAQWICALAILSGRFARPALLAGSALLLYTMFCDRLWFHNYRHTMIAFSTLLAFSPCDRHWVFGRAANEEAGPLWAATAMRAQISVMYIASGGRSSQTPTGVVG